METPPPAHLIIWWHAVATIALWWVSNLLAVNASKNAMKGAIDVGRWTASPLEDLRWIDLTAFQHVISSILSVLLLKMTKKSVFPSQMQGHGTMLCVAALVNVVGNLTRNAMYGLIGSNSVEVVRVCEPFFTVMLMMVLYREYGGLDSSTILSVGITVAGAITFWMVGHIGFSMLGFIAGVVLNMAVTIRNIYLKKLSNTSWDSPLQKYAIISIYGTVIMLPVLVAKALIKRGPIDAVWFQESVLSGIFHYIYSLASVAVLEHFSPVTHAILNISKLLFVTSAKILFFRSPITTSMIFGILVLIVGWYFYLRKSTWKVRDTCTWLRVLVLFAVFAYYLVRPSPSPSPSPPPPTTFVERREHYCSRISTAWVFDRPIPQNLLFNIKALSEIAPCKVYMYCGNTQCFEAINNFKHNISPHFLVLHDLVQGTKLKRWIDRHPLNKLIAGKEFETHLQVAVRLGILWKYGGFYIDPTVNTTDALKFIMKGCEPQCNSWINHVEHSRNSIFDLTRASFFTAQHPFIEKLVDTFVSEYPTERNGQFSPMFNFQRSVWNNAISCDNCPVVLDNVHLKSLSVTSNTNHYGIFTQDTQEGRDAVLEDLAILQYLPFVDTFIEKDKLVAVNNTDHLDTWWVSSTFSRTPSNSSGPTNLSFHIENVREKWIQHIDYLKKRQPIGCSDSATVDFLKKRGVKAFLSVGLTLLWDHANVISEKTDNVYLDGVETDLVVKLLPSQIREKSISVSHKLEEGNRMDRLARLTEMYELMGKYGSAKLVITQHIHCALLCVAMGTPVIFINSPSGKPRRDATLSAGDLTPLFHTLDLYTLKMEEAKKWSKMFSWDNVPPNPNASMMMRLRATAWNAIRSHRHLYDAARKFGIVPMSSSPISSNTTTKLLFHIIFTTSNKSKIALLTHNVEQSGRFNWRHWRTVESIFYHHPTAEVVVHSNTLPHDTFDVLTESGYSIRVQNYDLVELWKGSPAAGFASKLNEARRGHFWYSHQTDLLRLLFLYQSGGVYMDTDMILVRSLDSLPANVLGFEDSNHNNLNGAFMKFEKQNLYLKTCLKEFAGSYNGNSWGGNGPGLLTRVWRSTNWNIDTVLTVGTQYFYMFFYEDVMSQCFHDISGKKFDKNWNTFRNEAFVVHLNSKITGHLGIQTDLKNGTICSHLLNAYCVLCNNIH